MHNIAAFNCFSDFRNDPLAVPRKVRNEEHVHDPKIQMLSLYFQYLGCVQIPLDTVLLLNYSNHLQLDYPVYLSQSHSK